MIPNIVLNPEQKFIQKSSLNRVIKVGYKIQRLLYNRISTPWKDAEIIRNLLVMVTIRPKLWPIGPVQQRTVTVGKMKISINPIVANKAEMDRLKKLLFLESTPKCS